MTYQEQLNTFEWHLRKLQILTRDNFKCVKCQSTERLCVHHKKYAKHLQAWEYNDQYLETLCSVCHDKEHKDVPIGDFYITERKLGKFKFPKALLKMFGKK